MTSIRQERSARGPVRRWLPYWLVGGAAAGLAAFVSPVAALAVAVLPVVVLVFLFVFSSPIWGLILLLVSFYNPVVAYSRLALEPWSYAVTFGLLAICSVVLLVKPRRPLPEGWRATALGLFAVSAMLLLSAFHGLLAGNSPFQVASDLLQGSELFLAFGVTALLLWSHGGAGRLVRVVYAVFMVSLVWELTVYAFGGFGLVPERISALSQANLGGGGVLAGVSLPPAILFPVLFGAYFYGREVMKRPVLISIVLALGLSTLSIILTFKRSVWVAEVFAVLGILGVGLFLRPLRFAMRILGQGVLIGVVVLIAVSFIEIDGTPLGEFVVRRVEFTVDQLHSSSGQGLETRRFEYVIVGNEVKDSLAFGRGLGREFYGYVRGKPGTKHYLHNTYLALLHRSGLVGLALVLGTLALISGQILRRLRRVRTPLEQGIALGCLASFGSLAVQAVTTGRLLTHPVAAYVGFLLGLGLYLTSGGSLDDDADEPALEACGERPQGDHADVRHGPLEDPPRVAEPQIKA